jgi:hypothetical protein
MKPNASDVIKAYMKLRSQKADIEAEMKNRVAEVTAKMDKLEAYLHQQMHEQGVTTLKSEYGTAYISTIDTATVADWEAVIEYVKANDAYDMLERRVSKTAVRTYMERDGAVPPGVNFGQRQSVNFRKPSAKVD